ARLSVPAIRKPGRVRLPGRKPTPLRRQYPDRPKPFASLLHLTRRAPPRAVLARSDTSPETAARRADSDFARALRATRLWRYQPAPCNTTPTREKFSTADCSARPMPRDRVRVGLPQTCPGREKSA